MPEETEEAKPEDPRVAQFWALNEEVKNHVGTIAHQRWESLRLVLGAAKMNESVLLNTVSLDYASPEEEMTIVRMLGKTPEGNALIEQYWLYFFTHLANYTSTNYALIEHVRHVVRKYPDTGFAKEEERRRAVLLAAPETHFVNDLRVAITHIGTPPLSITMVFAEGKDTTYTAHLDADRLLKMGRWDAISKAWLRDQKTVDIRAVVALHAEMRDDFYKWLMAQFAALHADDIAAVNVLIGKTHTFWQDHPDPPAWSAPQ